MLVLLVLPDGSEPGYLDDLRLAVGRRQRYPGHFDVAARPFIETLAFDLNDQVRCLIRLLP